MGLTVAIVGATGAVGRSLVERLDVSRLEVRRLRLFASARNRGESLVFRGETLEVESARRIDFRPFDLVFFSAGAEVSRRLLPAAKEAGALVIDTSSAFRLDPAVPLVVPEVNGHALRSGARTIANPNCSAAILSLPLRAIETLSPLERVLVATYQAASGVGRRGVTELEAGVRSVLDGTPEEVRVFPRPIAFNVVPEVGAFSEGGGGFTGEELKIATETRKILDRPDLKIAATCVRVPVKRAHSEAVYVETREVLELAEVREVLRAFPGLECLDEPARPWCPVPRQAEGRCEVLVGRCRRDPDVEHGLHFWVVGDQLLKGAALNAVQIAEAVLGPAE